MFGVSVIVSDFDSSSIIIPSSYLLQEYFIWEGVVKQRLITNRVGGESYVIENSEQMRWLVSTVEYWFFGPICTQSVWSREEITVTDFCKRL